MTRNAFAYASAAGVRLPSVTEVMKIAGIGEDFSSVSAGTLERARERGSDAHAWVEGIVKGWIDDEDPPEHIAGLVAGFHRFRGDTAFEAIECEATVVSETHGYAGTLDLFGKLGGALWVLDMKCTAQVPKSAAVQTAAYRMATPPAWAARSARRGVLHLRRDGTYQVVEHKDHRLDEHDFLAALRVANWRLRNGLAQLEDF